MNCYDGVLGGGVIVVIYVSVVGVVVVICIFGVFLSLSLSV